MDYCMSSSISLYWSYLSRFPWSQCTFRQSSLWQYTIASPLWSTSNFQHCSDRSLSTLSSIYCQSNYHTASCGPWWDFTPKWTVPFSRSDSSSVYSFTIIFAMSSSFKQNCSRIDTSFPSDTRELEHMSLLISMREVDSIGQLYLAFVDRLSLLAEY